MKNTVLRHRKSLLAVASCLALSAPAWGQDSGSSNFKISGFLSVVGGKVTSGSLAPDYSGGDPLNGTACPCYIADWSNAGIYGSDFSLTPESRVGLQASYELTPNAKLVAQVVTRGTNGTPDITWAYGSYKLSRSWEVQLGRKRIPLYYYSDFQDIGVSYPWVTPPPEVYGWDATNYNGGSIRYTRAVGDSNIAASLFAGREDIEESLYSKLYSASKTNVTWKNIVGADIEVNNGPLTVRGVYLQSDVETTNEGAVSPAKLVAYGVAANLDFDKWFVLSEITQLSREFPVDDFKYTAPAYTVGVGVRLGKFTPFLNIADYRESTNNEAAYSPASYHRTSFTVRYDINSNSAFKVQMDRMDDLTHNGGGDTNIFRVGYDLVF